MLENILSAPASFGIFQQSYKPLIFTPWISIYGMIYSNTHKYCNNISKINNITLVWKEGQIERPESEFDALKRKQQKRKEDHVEEVKKKVEDTDIMRAKLKDCANQILETRKTNSLLSDVEYFSINLGNFTLDNPSSIDRIIENLEKIKCVSRKCKKKGKVFDSKTNKVY